MVKMEVEGVDRVIASLRGQSLKGKKVMTGSVIYDAPYAVYVHEDLEAYHPHGQAKYLEQPAREHATDMTQIVRRSVVNKNGLEEGVQRALDYLLGLSQPLVPVDTGYLKSTGKTEIVEGVQ